MVVATTDHGDMVGAHRMWIKGWIPYEETYRVPLIIRWPGHIPAGSRTDRLVQTHDLAYTYVAAAGATADAVQRRACATAAVRGSCRPSWRGSDPVRLLWRGVPIHAADRDH